MKEQSDFTSTPGSYSRTASPTSFTTTSSPGPFLSFLDAALGDWEAAEVSELRIVEYGRNNACTYVYTAPIAVAALTIDQPMALVPIASVGTVALCGAYQFAWPQRSHDVGWLSAARAAGPNEYDVDLLTVVVQELEQMLRHGRFELMSTMFRSLPVEELSPQLLLTVLRTTSAAKVLIPGWFNLLQKVGASFDARGLNSRKLLRGL